MHIIRYFCCILSFVHVVIMIHAMDHSTNESTFVVGHSNGKSMQQQIIDLNHRIRIILNCFAILVDSDPAITELLETDTNFLMYYIVLYGYDHVLRHIFMNDQYFTQEEIKLLLNTTIYESDMFPLLIPCTLLHAAVIMNNVELVKLFLELGADPNVPDVENNTPLHTAHEQNNIEISNLLLKGGALQSHDVLNQETSIQSFLGKQFSKIISNLFFLQGAES